MNAPRSVKPERRTTPGDLGTSPQIATMSVADPFPGFEVAWVTFGRARALVRPNGPSGAAEQCPGPPGEYPDLPALSLQRKPFTEVSGVREEPFPA